MTDPAKAASATRRGARSSREIMDDAPWAPSSTSSASPSRRAWAAPDNIYVDPTRVINYDAIYVKE